MHDFHLDDKFYCMTEISFLYYISVQIMYEFVFFDKEKCYGENSTILGTHCN